MRGVFAQANVGDDQQRKLSVLDACHRFLNDAGFGVRIASDGVLLLRYAKQQDGFYAGLDGFVCFAKHRFQGVPVLAGEGVDRLGPG